MVLLLLDFQSARTGLNCVTGMRIVRLTSRWTARFMSGGQHIFGLPTTYGSPQVNSHLSVFPHDHLARLAVSGEHEGPDEAWLHKIEVAGFGGEDLTGPLTDPGRRGVHVASALAILRSEPEPARSARGDGRRAEAYTVGVNWAKSKVPSSFSNFVTASTFFSKPSPWNS